MFVKISAMIRISPYPPSFRSTPAKIIEPPRGASTWAFGSHKCTKNIGNFTKNTKIRKYHQYMYTL